MSLYRTISETEATGEIVAVVDVFCGTNRIAIAHQAEPDVTPDPV